MLERALLVSALLAALTVVGLWWRSRDGRVRVLPAGATDDVTTLTADEIDSPLGAVVTFVQLSSTTCAPCRRTAAVLAELAAAHDGVTHVELDVDQHARLVRRLNVLRTPTVLALDRTGRLMARASGVVAPPQALAMLESSRHAADGAPSECCPGTLSAR